MNKPLGKIMRKLTGLEGRQENLLRIGYVTEVLEKEAKVRVECQDQDVLKTYKLPVLCHKSRCDKDYWMPDVGEHVLCVFLPYGQHYGFVLGSFYSEKDLPPVASCDKAHIRWLDGTWIEYDRGTHVMQVHCLGKVLIASAEEIELKAPIVKMPNPIITGPGEAEIKPVEPSPIPPPAEWPYG